MHKFSFYALAAILAVSTPACAQPKKAASGSGNLQVLEATRQTTISGRPGMEPFTIYRLRVIWKNNAAPTPFFWRPDAKSWMETHIAKPIKRPGLAPGDFMVIERNMTAKDVRYGDTLILTTRRHAHDEEPMPSEVKKMPAGSLYYQTAASAGKWQYAPITIRQMPDIKTP